MVSVGFSTSMCLRGLRAMLLSAGLLGLSNTWAQAQEFLPDPAVGAKDLPPQIEAFSPGTPLGKVWEAFVQAQNVEHSSLALQQLDVLEPLVEASYGRVSEQMAMVLGHRTVAHLRLGQLIEAEASAQEALATNRSLSGPTSEQTLNAVNTLATVYLADRGRGLVQRRVYANEAAQLLEAGLGQSGASPIPTETLRALQNSLGVSYFILERPADAVTLYRTLLEPLATTRPPSDPELISLSINLAYAHSAAGQEALKEAEGLTVQMRAMPPPVDPALTARRDALDESAVNGDFEADRILAALIEATPEGPATRTLQYANLLSARARLGMDPGQRYAALSGAVERYHQAGCHEAEARREQWIAAGGQGYPWTTADPDCSGDLRLARALSGYRGLAFAEKVSSPPRTFAAVRHLANASDVVVGATRLTYARSQEARLAFNRHRYVHREFVDTAWAAVSP